MEQKIINNLRKQIQAHIDAGGSIYAPRRELPYYYNLNYAYRKYRDIENPTATMEDMYALCGFEFDREYSRFSELQENLSLYADDNNYVDEIKKLPTAKSTKNSLTQFAREMGCSPSDYLVLMTNYRYKNAIIQTDYIANLNQELQEKYPDGDVSKIKRENPKLYHKLVHFYRYSPIPISMQDAATFFGIKNTRFSDNNYEENVNEEEVVTELLTKYQGKSILNLPTNDPKLYNKIVKCAYTHDKTVEQWLERFDVILGRNINNARFSRTQVDASSREKELMRARNEVLAENSFEEPKTEVGKYRLRKRIAQLILDKINSIDTPSPISE